MVRELDIVNKDAVNTPKLYIYSVIFLAAKVCFLCNKKLYVVKAKIFVAVV